MTLPNFARLDADRPEVSRLMTAMLQAREALSRRAWSHPLEYAGEEWWADVLADPRARRQTRGSHSRGALNIYRLRDEPREIILVACTKCDWKVAYSRDELIALHGADCAMPDLLDDLAAPGCSKNPMSCPLPAAARAPRAAAAAHMPPRCPPAI
jgi:hypothetical protein